MTFSPDCDTSVTLDVSAWLYVTVSSPDTPTVNPPPCAKVSVPAFETSCVTLPSETEKLKLSYSDGTGILK